MSLPLLISVPHAGTAVPPEVSGLCLLSRQDVVRDGDEGAEDVYGLLRSMAGKYVTTPVARAVIDANRAPDDFSADGVVKTHTCQGVPVYDEPLSGKLVSVLIDTYYRPYHAQLQKSAAGMLLGIDCHTMAPTAPRIAPDAGTERPSICLSNAGFTCPDEWLHIFADCLEQVFQKQVSLNSPFQGGYIIRSHARNMPWVQIELSREDSLSTEEKSGRLAEALGMLCDRIGKR